MKYKKVLGRQLRCGGGGVCQEQRRDAEGKHVLHVLVDISKDPKTSPWKRGLYKLITVSP